MQLTATGRRTLLAPERFRHDGLMSEVHDVLTIKYRGMLTMLGLTSDEQGRLEAEVVASLAPSPPTQ